MARKRHKPEEIVAKLREVDVLVSQGQNMSDAIRQIGVSEVTYYRWRQEFGGAPDPRFVVWRSSEIICRRPGASGFVPHIRPRSNSIIEKSGRSGRI